MDKKCMRGIQTRPHIYRTLTAAHKPHFLAPRIPVCEPRPPFVNNPL
jgi:hypothetical protein